MNTPGNNSTKNDNPYSPNSKSHQNWETQRIIQEGERKRREYADILKESNRHTSAASPPKKAKQPIAKSVPTKKTKPTKPQKKKTETNPENMVRGLFGLAGFLISFIPIFQADNEKWILALIAGAVCGGLAAKFYKGILILAAIVFIFFLISQNQ